MISLCPSHQPYAYKIKDNILTHHIYKLGASVKGYISYKDSERQKLNIVTKIKKD